MVIIKMVCPICITSAIIANAPLISASLVGSGVVAVKLKKNVAAKKVAMVKKRECVDEDVKKYVRVDKKL
jgi:predicted transporter